jgi:F0F1-type ATP synthase membrane subunit c/vacuolar-type H+-ATPase subunit K
VGGIEHSLEVVLIFAIAILGPSLIIAAGGHASIQALGRNPSAASKIFTAMIVLLVFGAAIAVIALLVLFQLYAPA